MWQEREDSIFGIVLLVVLIALLSSACSGDAPSPTELSERARETAISATGGTAGPAEETRENVEPTETPPEPTPTPFVCDQPQMFTVSESDIAPIQTLSFLELPFPYGFGKEEFGFTDAEFLDASQRTPNGGRINSFFDHLYPLYPSSHNGREPADPPVADHVLRFDGALSRIDNYSGHPGYDFSTLVPREPSTPVFAAADGVLDFVGECCGGALTVKIRHTVEGFGEFQTIYMHLHPDEWFEAVYQARGKGVEAGTRIGTMGNTGWSTGHHLHFEVRFDGDGDGKFTLNEVVDPYGYTPGPEYPDDPWLKRTEGQGGSPYLWIHPLGSAASVGEDGGGEMKLQVGDDGEAEEASVCLQPGTLLPGGTLIWSWSPDPRPTKDLAGTGNGGSVSGVDAGGGIIDFFDPPLRFQFPFTVEDLVNVDPLSLDIYRYSPSSMEWIPLSAQIDLERNMATFFLDEPGQFALLGTPTRDLVPPTTVLNATGGTSEKGEFYEAVTVELSSSDPSGIEVMEYSLDNGETWIEYSGPFTIEPWGLPTPLADGEEPVEQFGGDPGQFQVLVSSTDGAGNLEEPPGVHVITIDPTESPEPTAVALKDVNCRLGHGLMFDAIDILLQHEVVRVVARNADNSWWKVVDPRGLGQCWVSSITVAVSDAAHQTPVLFVPTPTPPATPTPEPPAAPGRLVARNGCSSTTRQVSLTWRDNSNNEDGFRVMRDGKVIATIGPNSTSYIDEPGNGAHTYSIVAFNAGGQSASNSDSVDPYYCII